MRTTVRLAAFAMLSFGLVYGTLADDAKKDDAKPVTTKSGLKYIELKEGTGDRAQTGDRVEVRYTGWLKNGTKFDSNVGKNPLPFKIGAADMVKGFEEGVTGMRVGGKRKLIIPPDLAFGDDGRPPAIPPKSEVTFEIELLKIK